MPQTVNQFRNKSVTSVQGMLRPGFEERTSRRRGAWLH